MSGDLRDRIMEHVDVFEKCGKQQSAAFLREINERIDSLEAENAALRAELAALRQSFSSTALKYSAFERLQKESALKLLRVARDAWEAGAIHWPDSLVLHRMAALSDDWFAKSTTLLNEQVAPYRVEQHEQAEVAQGEWKVVE